MHRIQIYSGSMAVGQSIVMRRYQKYQGRKKTEGVLEWHIKGPVTPPIASSKTMWIFIAILLLLFVLFSSASPLPSASLGIL